MSTSLHFILLFQRIAIILNGHSFLNLYIWSIDGKKYKNVRHFIIYESSWTYISISDTFYT